MITELLNPKEETDMNFDIVNLEVSPDEDYLLFVSQVNNALWSLQLPEKGTLPEVSTELEL